MDMVERVAEAIAKQLGLIWRLLPEVGDSEMTPSKRYFRFQARAAIAAMREPTGAMLEPIQRMPLEMVCAPGIAGIRLARETRESAIDAALGE